MNVFIKTFGCQMNVSDSELIAGIITAGKMKITENLDEADAILVNTCTVRQHAEDRALGHIQGLMHLRNKKSGLKIGLLGCAAQRLGNDVREKYPGIDFVVGPDGYRLLPQLLKGEQIAGDPLSLGEEYYENILPQRQPGITAWTAISRGCDEHCSYCIVPYTRGKERSRPVSSIIREVEDLRDKGFKEVTLLGQNVNSYMDNDLDFAALLEKISLASEGMRIRFATSHPMNLSIRLLEVMKRMPNICRHLHIPVQSGSNRILNLMNRRYTREHYLFLVAKARELMPDVSVTTDIISGFPTETEEDHRNTVNLVEAAQFDSAFTFKYSPREGTEAWKLDDDVPDEVKVSRLEEISNLVRDIMLRKNQVLIGSRIQVLVETMSRRSKEVMVGRAGSNRKVLINNPELKPGAFITVEVTGCTSQSLFGDMTLPEKAEVII